MRGPTLYRRSTRRAPTESHSHGPLGVSDGERRFGDSACRGEQRRLGGSGSTTFLPYGTRPGRGHRRRGRRSLAYPRGPALRGRPVAARGRGQRQRHLRRRPPRPAGHGRLPAARSASATRSRASPWPSAPARRPATRAQPAAEPPASAFPGQAPPQQRPGGFAPPQQQAPSRPAYQPQPQPSSTATTAATAHARPQQPVSHSSRRTPAVPGRTRHPAGVPAAGRRHRHDASLPAVRAGSRAGVPAAAHPDRRDRRDAALRHSGPGPPRFPGSRHADRLPADPRDDAAAFPAHEDHGRAPASRPRCATSKARRSCASAARPRTTW